MSPLAQTLLISFGCLTGIMVILWLLSLARHDASIIDPFWGTGFVIIAWLSCGWNHATDPRSLLLAELTTVWGLRLSLYLLWRNANHGEDRRYAAMRAHHGANFAWVSLFTVFLLQAVILWFVAFPLQAALASQKAAPLTAIDAIGVAIWSLGFLFE
jgi:steroid 5-alpha reductase family enzyme